MKPDRPEANKQGVTRLCYILYLHSQTCIKRSLLEQRKKWPYKTGDLLKEVQFI